MAIALDQANRELIPSFTHSLTSTTTTSTTIIATKRHHLQLKPAMLTLTFMLHASVLLSVAAILPAGAATSTSSGFSLRRLEALEYQAVMVVPPPSCVVQNGFDFVGNDIANALGSSDSCCDKCATVAGCNAWSWSNLNGGTCWFKSAQGAVQANPNVKSALFFRGSVPFCTLDQDTDIVGNDIGSTLSGSAAACCGTCQSTFNCRAWAWTNLNGGTCWLKSNDAPKIFKAGVQSASAYPVAIGSCPVPVSGVDYVGNDIGSRASSTPEGCCDLCKSFNNCRAYSWTSQSGGTCYLKSAKTGVVASAGVTSAQIYPNAGAVCSAVENDVDYVGNDIANAQASDASLCCSLCGAKSGCGAWTWSNYNGGTCWLKSEKTTTAAKSGVKSAVLV